jgi:hypothetical protein
VNRLLRLFPPFLFVRFLDDVHAVAEAAKVFAARFDECIELGTRLDRTMAKALPLMRKMDRNTDTMIPLMEKTLPVMREANAGMAAALPVMRGIAPAMTQATLLTAPIGGAIGRVGRVVERLPGDRRKAPRSSG